MRGYERAAVPVILGLLVFQVVLGAGVASAQTTNWVTVLSINDVTGSQSLSPSDSQVAGHTYNVTMRVDVPPGSPGTKFQMALSPNVTSSGAQFWYLHTSSYAGYNRTTFTSSLRSVQFDQVVGTFVISAVYTLPLNLTAVVTNGVTLHLTRGNFQLITVTPYPAPAGANSVGFLVVTVVDQSIQTYLSDYQAASTLISSGKVSTSYSSLMQGVLALSQTLYHEGLTEEATTLLNSVTPSTLPTPPSTMSYGYLVIVVIILAVVAALLGVLWVRGRGRSGYASGVINQTNRELASLEVVAGRYDKALADQLKALREKLTEASD